MVAVTLRETKQKPQPALNHNQRQRDSAFLFLIVHLDGRYCFSMTAWTLAP
jgi:hypothetical protein